MTGKIEKSLKKPLEDIQIGKWRQQDKKINLLIKGLDFLSWYH